MKLYARKIIKLEDKNVDPRTMPRAPPISNEQQSNEPQKSLKEQVQYAADNENYPQAIVINELLEKGLINNEDLSEAFKATKGKQGALKWDALKNYLINLSQNRALEKIKKEDFASLNNLLPTPEAKLLRKILQENLLTEKEISEFAQKYESFIEFITMLLKDRFIKPVFDNILEHTVGEFISDRDRELLFGSVFAEIHRFIFNNPNLLKQIRSGDIGYNPYPMNNATEAMTLRQLILLQLLQIVPSQTQEHTFGNASLMRPLVMYVVRQIDKALTEKTDAQALMKSYARFFRAMLIVTRVMHRDITERNPWENKKTKDDKGRLIGILFDEDIYDLFEFLIKSNKSFLSVLQEKYATKGIKINNSEKIISSFNNETELLQSLSNMQDINILLDEKLKEISGGPGKANPMLKERVDPLLELKALCSLFKTLILTMSKDKYPEATNADESTKKRHGLWALYFGRILKPLFSLEKYWGVQSTLGRRIIMLVGLLSIVGSIGAMICLPGLPLACITLPAALIIVLLPIVFGKASQPQEKLFWGSIIGVSSAYIFGLMVHHIFWKVALISLASSGFWITLILVALTVIPTIISFYHLAVTVRSYIALKKTTWNKTARSMIGLTSFLPWRFGSRYWKKTFKKWFQEFKETEEAHMSLIGSGESIAEYLQRLVTLMRNNWLLSDYEYDEWLKALKGEEDGCFVNPKYIKGHEVLYNAFFALSQTKPVPDIYALLESTSTHLQAAGEVFTHTFVNSAYFGTFHNNPKTEKQNSKNTSKEVKQASLLGYMARINRTSWKHLIDFIKKKVDNDSLIEQLKAIDEYTNIPELIFIDNKLSEEDIRLIVNSMMAWLNELRPTNKSVAESMGQDYIEYHLFTSYQVGDFEYHNAVREIVLDGGYVSLKQAYEQLITLQKIKRVVTLEKMKRVNIENIFIAGYLKYQRLVDIKLRAIFNEANVWGNIDADPKTKEVNAIDALSNFVKGLKEFGDKADTPEDIKVLVKEVLQFNDKQSPLDISSYGEEKIGLDKW
ncbi:hypothetical protein ACFL4C_03115, partial [Candidatus Omnitrophota bacterium]